jgi:hypothetical protein
MACRGSNFVAYGQKVSDQKTKKGTPKHLIDPNRPKSVQNSINLITMQDK